MRPSKAHPESATPAAAATANPSTVSGAEVPRDLFAGLLPDARLTIYADSAHSFQHHSQSATDVTAFLGETT
jgi:hypothetical protein